MTPEQTLELFERCQSARKEAARDIWNKWAEALLQRRDTIESDGEKIGDWEREAKADFSLINKRDKGHRFCFAGFVFPGAVDFHGLTFDGDVDFTGAIFHGPAKFAAVKFGGQVTFERTDFRADAGFQGSSFQSAGFQAASFHKIDFQHCGFDGVVDFSDVKFGEYSIFERTEFRSSSFFQRASFLDKANFQNAKFVNAEFNDSNFSYADFTRAEFGVTTFENANFSGNIFFNKAVFRRDVDFQNISLAKEKVALFEGAIFHDEANFKSATLRGRAGFSSAKFFGDAFFDSVNFRSNAIFLNAEFEDAVSFKWAQFRIVTFENAHFSGNADFSAIRGERAFDLAGVKFEKVPNFIQAHFEEAPRLDNIQVRGRIWDSAPRAKGNVLRKWCMFPRRAAKGIHRRLFRAHDIPARWRALKRLAIQGHDADREHEFFAREVKAGRYATDPILPLARPKWALPWWLNWLNWIPFVFWRGAVWAGFFRFWFGILYQIFSDLGRSVLRPFIIWAALIFTFSVYFLGENEHMAAERARDLPSNPNSVEAYAYTTFVAIHSPPSCYPYPVEDTGRSVPDGFSGLVGKARGSTDIVQEAFSIAYHNAFVVLDSSGDSAHRAFGCLYGVERYGDNPVSFVPRQVAIASGIQKLLSGVLIFLFSLALRNMLKMK